MPYKKTRLAILNLLDNVFYYGIDVAPELSIGISNDHVDSPATETLQQLKEVGLGRLTITEKNFHDELFARLVYHDLITELVSTAATPQPLAALRAPAGWGKTSALAAAAKFAESFEMTCIIVDFKKAYDDLHPSHSTATNALQSKIHELQRTAMRHQLNRAKVDDYRYFANLVAGVTDKDTSSEVDDIRRMRLINLRSHLEHYRDRITKLPQPASLDPDASRADRIDSWTTFLHTENRRLNAQHIDLYRSEIADSITLSQQIAIYLCLNVSHRIILMYDNIDFLERDQRLACYNYALAAHNSLHSMTGSVVAIRDENYSDIRFARVDSGGAFVRKLIPSNFAKKPQIEQSTEHSPHIHEAIADSSVKPESLHVLEYLTRRCEFTWEKIRAANPPDIDIQQRALTEVSDAAQIVVKTLLKLDIARLSNQNMRAIAHYFTEFWYDLYRIEHAELRTASGHIFHDTVVNEIIKHPSRVETRFYIWLHVNAEDLAIRLPNVVSITNRAGNGATVADMLSLDHLLLSSVYNAARDTRVAYYEIVRRLKAFGFEPNQIHPAFCRLAKKNESLLSIVGDIRVSEDNSDNTEVRLSPLGTSMLVNVFSSVGYTLAGLLSGTTFPEKMHDYYLSFRTSDERAVKLLDYLVKVARAHLRALDLLRDRADHSPELSSESWLHTYLSWFCIDGRTQIERQFEAAIDFYRGSGTASHSLFDSALAQYKQCRSDLGNGIPFDSLDLRSLDMG